MNAGSFDQTNRLSALLATEAPLLSQEQANRLREAEKENGQLQGAFDFDSNLSAIEAKILASRPSPAIEPSAEEPF